MFLPAPFRYIVFVLVALCYAGQAHAGFDEGLAAFDKGNFAEAYQQWRPAAEKGDPRAQGRLGYLYMADLGVEGNVAMGIAWYRKAAEQNDAFGQLGLGNIYMAESEHLPKNIPEGLRLTRQAADQGLASAQFTLGVLYRMGDCVPQDAALSEMFYTKAGQGSVFDARQGHLGAKTRVSYFFVFGQADKVSVNRRQAIDWLTEAAATGFPEAQSNLAFDYLHGYLVERDEKQALFWYEKSAAQDDAPGQYELSKFYEHGKVVAKDDACAVELLKKAADQAHLSAQYELGLRYHTGRGVPQDDALAIQWIEKAAAQDLQIAKDMLKQLRGITGSTTGE